MRHRFSRIAWDLLMGSAVGLLCGLASGGFLWALERVLGFRQAHPFTLALLPVLGVLTALLYHAWGGKAEAGTALVLDEVMEWRGGVPSRMVPLVLAGTLLSHLGGASVGREGTAVQMGASLASSLSKLPGRFLALLRLTRARRRMMLQAGLAGGFGSVFGTPMAGALFGLEVAGRGRLATDALLICLSASLVGDRVVRFLGTRHPVWMPQPLPTHARAVFGLLAFALLVAAVVWIYLRAAHGLAAWSRDRFTWWARPLLGGSGFILLGLWANPLHLNLGTGWLSLAFAGAPASLGPVAMKLVLTAWCLGWGFKGGEVTPLFVSGALLGAAAAPWLGLPPTGLAAVGFATLFAAASHTPLAGLLVGVECFGVPFAMPILLVGSLAYTLVGHRSLYRLSQQTGCAHLKSI